MDMPGGTLLGLKFLLTSKRYRDRVLAHIKDPTIADFWRVDFEEHMPESEQRQQTLSTLNKIGALISDPAIRACIGQPQSKLDLDRHHGRTARSSSCRCRKEPSASRSRR